MRAVSPSLKCKVGPGIAPLMVMPEAGFPVMLTFCCMLLRQNAMLSFFHLSPESFHTRVRIGNLSVNYLYMEAVSWW